MSKVHWSWQAVLCLVLLVLAWLIYAASVARYWRRRKEAFFLIRTPWLAVLASTCNLACISSILLQCIVESTSYTAEQAGVEPSTLPHYPCLVVMFTSIYLYPAQLTGGVLRTVIAVIRWDPQWRISALIPLIRFRTQLKVVAAAAALTCCLAAILVGAFPRYRDNMSGMQCHYQQEWYLYIVVGPIMILGVRAISQGIKEMDDVFSLGYEVRMVNKIGAMADAYYIVNIIFDSLSWAGSDVSRAHLELVGLPFDLMGAALHAFYFYQTILGPVLWSEQYKRRYSHESSSNSALSETKTGPLGVDSPASHLPPSKWSLVRALRDPACYVLLKKHAQRLMCGEYLSFWDQCEARQLQLISQGQAGPLEEEDEEFFREVFAKYVDVHAPYAVNVSDTLRTAYATAVVRATLQSGAVVGADGAKRRVPTVTPVALRSSASSASPTAAAILMAATTERGGSLSVDLRLSPQPSPSPPPHNPFSVRSSASIAPYPARHSRAESRTGRHESHSTRAGGKEMEENSELAMCFTQVYNEVLQLMDVNIWADFKRSAAFTLFSKGYTLQ